MYKVLLVFKDENISKKDKKNEYLGRKFGI